MHLYTSIPVDVLVFTIISNLDRDSVLRRIWYFDPDSELLRIHHDVGRPELIIPLIGLLVLQLYRAKLPSIQLAAHMNYGPIGAHMRP
jgi:hypothetical protein